MTALLIARGSDLNKVEKYGSTPLLLAARVSQHFIFILFFIFEKLLERYRRIVWVCLSYIFFILNVLYAVFFCENDRENTKMWQHC